MPKILLIDDDRDLVQMITEWLDAANYNYEIAHDGRVGWEFIRQGVYDVIVIDWNLPGMEGPDICRKYRASKGITPIIMLTGKGQIEDKETGLDAGADDYLTKPFSLKELMARIRAQLRRQTGKFANTIKVGDLEMDTTEHRITMGGEPIRLQPKDFAVLELFMRHPGEVFSSDSILQRVWNLDGDVGSDAVRTSIKRLRKALDKSENESDSLIGNIPRVGYRLRAQRQL